VRRRSGRPLLIAHRAGNDLRLLREAEALAVDAVEADVHLHRGRLELRHARTLGPLPLYWESRRLRRSHAGGLTLEALLAEAAPQTRLLLDLKGVDPGLPGELRRALAASGIAPARVAVCGRAWPRMVLAELPGLRVLPSVGDARELAALDQLLRERQVDGASVRSNLLAGGVAARLRERLPLLLAWPVNDARAARELAGLGVDGLITDRPELVRAALAA
jgi:hypothetical protein